MLINMLFWFCSKSYVNICKIWNKLENQYFQVTNAYFYKTYVNKNTFRVQDGAHGFSCNRMQKAYWSGFYIATDL